MIRLTKKDFDLTNKILTDEAVFEMICDDGMTEDEPGLDVVLGELDIASVESKMLQHEQVECPVIHRFSPGLYIREVKIPADTLALGHHQKFEQLNLFLSGKITMLNDDGTTSELTAPMFFTGPPGRKIGYAHEDVVWLNVYPNPYDETDIDKLESHWVEKSEVWIEDKKRKEIEPCQQSQRP